jgi:hypothetical protein
MITVEREGEHHFNLVLEDEAEYFTINGERPDLDIRATILITRDELQGLIRDAAHELQEAT